MNMLIVDDSPVVLTFLVTKIDWKAVGIDKVYSASSSLLAKNILEHNRVQILLTDIEMPVENGLELIHWIKNREMDIECILLTSHTDFSYAKQGIKLGVVDYVVQPAANADIISAVEKAINRHRSRTQAQQDQMAGEFSNYEMNRAVKHFFQEWPDPRKKDFEELLDAHIRRLNELGYICGKDDECCLFLTRIEEWNTLPLSGIDFRQVYADEARSVFSFANGQAATYSEDDVNFITALFMKSYNDVENYLEILQRQICEKLQCSIRIYYCFTNFRDFLFAHRYITSMEYSGDSGKTAGIQKLYLTAAHRNLDQAPQNYKDYYAQIVNYIRSNISSPITRQEISEHVHISPDYISHIVRSIAECSCKELIAQEKMKRARMLIETTTRPIGDIAADCGFDSFAYFSKVYKSTYGVSPTHTRRL